MKRGERGGRRKKWRKWDGEKEKGGGFKSNGGRRREKDGPSYAPPGLREERGGRREKDGPSYAPPKKKKKKILGTQIFLAQLNGVWAPLCKAKRF